MVITFNYPSSINLKAFGLQIAFSTNCPVLKCFFFLTEIIQIKVYKTNILKNHCKVDLLIFTTLVRKHNITDASEISCICILPGHGKANVSLVAVSDSVTAWTVCNMPGSSVRGILQARIPEWLAIPFSRGSF